MENGPTPHLEGIRGDYAPTVLVPGDPKRAKFIADNYLNNARQVNSVRGADGFTGSIDGVPVSVQAVGMGIPSALIYYTELIRFYGVKRLIRVGSCGGLNESVGLGDLICASTAGTDSAAITQLNRGLSLPSAAHHNWHIRLRFLLVHLFQKGKGVIVPIAPLSGAPVWPTPRKHVSKTD